ncbi:DUF2637 domain-containing protein [Micromonospora taraxaci]|uniref:DUF2637 domain-containing protein n=1 Tax=Micromonospora taraxaci TaxID=1316803 RepID=UPI0033DAFC59
MSRDWTKVRTIAFGVLAGTVASAGTLAVTVAGFALSYDAIRAVGIASHIRTEWAWLLPVSVDGAMAVATIAAVVLRRMTGQTAWYPWAVVLVGAAISIACNGLHAIPAAGAKLIIEQSQVRFAVSAIPAVMLALSVHLLVTLVEAASGSNVKPREVDAWTRQQLNQTRAEAKRAALRSQIALARGHAALAPRPRTEPMVELGGIRMPAHLAAQIGPPPEPVQVTVAEPVREPVEVSPRPAAAAQAPAQPRVSERVNRAASTDTAKKLDQAHARLKRRLKREPTNPELAQAAGVSLASVKRWKTTQKES